MNEPVLAELAGRVQQVSQGLRAARVDVDTDFGVLCAWVTPRDGESFDTTRGEAVTVLVSPSKVILRRMQAPCR